MLHGAKSLEDAESEINLFFPVEKTLAAIKPDAIGTKGKQAGYIFSQWTLLIYLQWNAWSNFSQSFLNIR